MRAARAAAAPRAGAAAAPAGCEGGHARHSECRPPGESPCCAALRWLELPWDVLHWSCNAASASRLEAAQPGPAALWQHFYTDPQPPTPTRNTHTYHHHHPPQPLRPARRPTRWPPSTCSTRRGARWWGRCCRRAWTTNKPACSMAGLRGAVCGPAVFEARGCNNCCNCQQFSDSAEAKSWPLSVAGRNGENQREQASNKRIACRAATVPAQLPSYTAPVMWLVLF